MCSVTGNGDLTGNDSWELGGLGAKILEEAKGLNGPRGNGSTRGRGGNRRSSVISVALGALAIERTLLRSSC